jgi:tRNA G18 (ribose-2'-O)-methylase SpoU
VLAGARRIAALERVNDHENLGVLFRNAAAFGIDAVVLDHETADPLYRRTVRVSIGHVCTVPWTRYERVDDLRDAGFDLIALTPARDAVPIGEVVWPARAALLLGAEGPGLDPETLARADVRARVPIGDGVDSLNVATAAAVAFYEATRPA